MPTLLTISGPEGDLSLIRDDIARTYTGVVLADGTTHSFLTGITLVAVTNIQGNAALAPQFPLSVGGFANSPVLVSNGLTVTIGGAV